MTRSTKLLTMFDSSYEGLPAARFGTAQECAAFQQELAKAGFSYKTKVVPPKGKRRAREMVVMLLSTRGVKSDGFAD